ncbi:MAG: M67 family metallopeptidase [Pseudomonadota bacterium]
MDILVTSQVLEGMRSATQIAHPHEACGILLGKGRQVTSFAEAANVHSQPRRHFEIDPQALIHAFRTEREGGLHVLGYFHSHPEGPAAPSITDHEMAAGDDKIWAIVNDREVAFWQDTSEGFKPLSYHLADE